MSYNDDTRINKSYAEFEKKNYDNIFGIFKSEDNVNRLLDELSRLGLQDNVSVLMSDETRSYYHNRMGLSNAPGPSLQEGFEQRSKLPEGSATGGLLGGLLGIVIGSLTLVGNVLAPGVGLLVAGPLVGALTGGAVGVAAGGLLGALVGIGIPEIEAKVYDESLKQQGNILVGVHVPKNRNIRKNIQDLFERYGSVSVKAV